MGSGRVVRLRVDDGVDFDWGDRFLWFPSFDYFKEGSSFVDQLVLVPVRITHVNDGIEMGAPVGSG